MRKLVLLVAVALAVSPSYGLEPRAMFSSLGAPVSQDLVGDFQGTLKLPTTSLRIVIKFSKGEKGLAARFFFIDQPTAPPMNASSASLDGRVVKLAIELIGGTYTGTLNPDGNAIAGNWTQAGTTLPLDLVRATKETAWEIPAAPAPPKQMAAEADPSFDIATIKPGDPGVTSMQGLGINGRNFRTKGSSLSDLMCFAYNVQMKQIIGAPDWMNTTRYDMDALPDTEGVPSLLQARSMVRKLLADRFKLTTHPEKRDINAFVLSVAKGGPKLTETEVKGPGPGLGLVPTPGGLTLILRKGTLADLASFMQSLVLDRPVVDQTGLTAKYDLSIKFMPDDSQFNGHPPPVTKSDTVEAFPSLFEAMQQQIGLKLEPQKTAVDVLAIDHVEKPSAN